MNPQEQENYEKALKRVNAKKELLEKFSKWVAISIFLFGINWITDPSFWWAFFPCLGMGLGVVIHTIKAFTKGPLSEDWEQRELQKQMARYQKNQSQTYTELPSLNKDSELDLNSPKQKQTHWNDKDLV